ncbi:MAG: hypothetical protein OER88_10720 [Planctomycetota bacterium]|nr:hypothetical protein [Planctomycetota bacterium]
MRANRQSGPGSGCVGGGRWYLAFAVVGGIAAICLAASSWRWRTLAFVAVGVVLFTGLLFLARDVFAEADREQAKRDGALPEERRPRRLSNFLIVLLGLGLGVWQVTRSSSGRQQLDRGLVTTLLAIGAALAVVALIWVWRDDSHRHPQTTGPEDEPSPREESR